jgi:hypothetical protein
MSLLNETIVDILPVDFGLEAEIPKLLSAVVPISFNS